MNVVYIIVYFNGTNKIYLFYCIKRKSSFFLFTFLTIIVAIISSCIFCIYNLDQSISVI